jgi:hypothetical protein
MDNSRSKEVSVKTRIAMIAFAVLTALSLAAPAFADRGDWHRGREWRGHEWREHEWREHHWRHYGPYAAYRSGYYYTPPPVVYGPPSFNVVIPFGR